MRPMTARTDDDEDPELGDVLDFMRLLWGVNHALEAWSKRMDATIGVTGPQRLVVRIVGQYPGISAGRLAEVLHVHPSTLTGILGRLERRGILKRSADPDDRRRALFGLTAQGRKLDGLRTGTVEAAVRRALKDLSPAHVGGARKVLSELAVVLDEPAEKPARRAKR
jgi:MarR family transcriptional regulator, organic hydroperoxide resistance regulator